MRKLPENIGAAARGAAIALLAAGLLWQTGRVAAAVYRFASIRGSVALLAPPKPPPVEVKPAPAEATTSGSPQPPQPVAEKPPEVKPEKPKVDLAAKYAALTKEPLLGPPLPVAPPPTLTAIIGDSAVINDQWVKVKGDVAGYKVVEIFSEKVVLEKDGKKTELTLFAGGGGGAPPPPSAPPAATVNVKPGPNQPAQPNREEKPASANPAIINRVQILGDPFGVPGSGGKTVIINGAAAPSGDGQTVEFSGESVEFSIEDSD